MPINLETVSTAASKAREATKKRKFTQSVELLINLKRLDLKKPENRINQVVALPHALPIKPKICVIASGDLVVKAKQAGVERILEREGLEELGKNRKAVKKLAKQYDLFFARTDMMPSVGRFLGPVLAPRGKMPTPIPPGSDLKAIIQKNSSAVRIQLRKDPIISVRIGSESMNDKEIAENAMAIIRVLEQKLDKGLEHLRSTYIKTTMGPPIKVEV